MSHHARSLRRRTNHVCCIARRVAVLSPVSIVIIMILLSGYRKGDAADIVDADAAQRAHHAQQLANRIDHQFAELWSSAGVTPNAPADDATLVRRLYLDLWGRIPTVGEARQFADNSDPNRFTALTTKLITSDRHRHHLANFWRKNWLPQTERLAEAESAAAFERWMVTQWRRGVRFDKLVRAMLVPEKTSEPIADSYSPSQAFARANEHSPARLAATTARAFLGIDLDCAQCHDHPFDRWTQQQFWQTAAFFSRPAVDQQGTVQLTITSDAQKTFAARLLNHSDNIAFHSPDAHEAVAIFADWIVSRDNPYFAKHTVNRLWSHFFDRDLVESVDVASSVSGHQLNTLRDELAQALMLSDFDLELLTQAIVLSRPYHLSSDRRPLDRASDDLLAFHSMPVRSLTGEQLFDSRRIAGGHLPLRPDVDPPALHEARRQFVHRFPKISSDAGRSIGQTLRLLNGPETLELLDAEETPLVGVVQEMPFVTVRERVEIVYWATLSRACTDEEWTTVSRFMEDHYNRSTTNQFYADLFWTLLNTAEFNSNH